MAIAVASLAGTLYEIPSSLNPPTVHTIPPAVFAYDGNAARVTVTTSPTTAGRTHLTLALNPAGDTIFLPFQRNQVHSVYIDMAAAGMGGVTGFLTPNLSGCRIYIDRVGVTNNLVIYHTNAVGTGPYIKPGQVAPSNPPDPLDMDKETPARLQALDAQYTTSKAYWTAAAPAGRGLILTNVAGLGATTYYSRAVNKVRTEQAVPGRTAVDFIGGVSVVGELIGGVWQIWWQIYGDCTYTGKGVAAVNMQVLPPAGRLL